MRAGLVEELASRDSLFIRAGDRVELIVLSFATRRDPLAALDVKHRSEAGGDHPEKDEDN